MPAITNTNLETTDIRHANFVAPQVSEADAIITWNTQEISTILLIETPKKDKVDSLEINSIYSWYNHLRSWKIENKVYAKLDPEEITELTIVMSKLELIEQWGDWPAGLSVVNLTVNQLILIMDYLYSVNITNTCADHLTREFLKEIMPYMGALVKKLNLPYESMANIYSYAVNPKTSDRSLFIDTFESIPNIEGTTFPDLIINNIFGNTWWGKAIKFLTVNERGWYSAREWISLLWDWISSMWSDDVKKWALFKENIDRYRFLIDCPKRLIDFLELSWVQCFGRYSKYVLGAQLRSLVCPNTGILMTPIGDHNGSSYETKKIFEKFFKEQEKIPDTHMAITEADNMVSLMRTMNTLKKMRKYVGIHTPFTYMILQTHWWSNVIDIWPADSYIDRELAMRFMITSDEEEELYSKRIQQFWNKYFDPNGYLVLASCKSGSDQWIAMRLSRILPEVTIVASGSIAYLNSLSYNNWDLRASFIGTDIGTEESKECEWKESVIYYKNGVVISK